MSDGGYLSNRALWDKNYYDTLFKHHDVETTKAFMTLEEIGCKTTEGNK